MVVSQVVGMLKNLKESEYEDMPVSGAVLDSRKVKRGQIFFACKGSMADGNRFAQDALDAGAALVVMDNARLYAGVRGNKALVEDTLAALRDMGGKRLAETKAVKMVITGSFGKTGTREMLSLVLKDRIHVYGTEANNNNELGVLLTACGIPNGAGVVIFEIGSNAPGEISALSRLINPHLALLTGAGHAHVGRFGSPAAVLREKLSVTDGMIPGGILVMHEDFNKDYRKLEGEARLKHVLSFGVSENADARLSFYEICDNTINFTIYMEGKEYGFQIYSPYAHLGENFAGVFIISQLLGIPYTEVKHAIALYRPPSGRGNIIRSGNLVIIDDTYNASLEAVLRSIDALARATGKKYALIGEVGEIDGYEDEIYGAIVAKSSEYPDIYFILAGEPYQKYAAAPNMEVLTSEEDVKRRVVTITEGTVLIKASHSYRFDRYRDMILANMEGRNAI